MHIVVDINGIKLYSIMMNWIDVWGPKISIQLTVQEPNTLS